MSVGGSHRRGAGRTGRLLIAHDTADRSSRTGGLPPGARRNSTWRRATPTAPSEPLPLRHQRSREVPARPRRRRTEEPAGGGTDRRPRNDSHLFVLTLHVARRCGCTTASWTCCGTMAWHASPEPAPGHGSHSIPEPGADCSRCFPMDICHFGVAVKCHTKVALTHRVLRVRCTPCAPRCTTAGRAGSPEAVGARLVELNRADGQALTVTKGVLSKGRCTACGRTAGPRTNDGPPDDGSPDGAAGRATGRDRAGLTVGRAAAGAAGLAHRTSAQVIDGLTTTEWAQF